MGPIPTPAQPLPLFPQKPDRWMIALAIIGAVLITGTLIACVIIALW
jgi:hypothetical protein